MYMVQYCSCTPYVGVPTIDPFAAGDKCNLPGNTRTRPSFSLPGVHAFLYDAVACQRAAAICTIFIYQVCDDPDPSSDIEIQYATAVKNVGVKNLSLKLLRFLEITTKHLC